MNIKVSMTAVQILDLGYWEKFCEAKGINPWAMNEGLIDAEEEFELPDDIANEILKLKLLSKEV